MADIQDAVYMRVQFHSDDVSVPITWTAQDTSLTANFGVIHEVHIGNPYTGDYTVIPTESEQILPTATLVMAENITIEPIPQNYGLITWDGRTLTVS